MNCAWAPLWCSSPHLDWRSLLWWRSCRRYQPDCLWDHLLESSRLTSSLSLLSSSGLLLFPAASLWIPNLQRRRTKISGIFCCQQTFFSFFFDKNCYLWSVLSGSSAPGGSHLWGGLGDRYHCPWLLSGWRILHLQHQRHYWAMKNRLHFGSEHPAVWYFEPSDWSADRLGRRLGLSLCFLWSGARKQLA